MKCVTYECDGVDCTKREPGTVSRHPAGWERVEVAWSCKHVHLHYCPDCWPAAQIALRLGGGS